MFSVKLNQKIQQKNSRVCVGLDPRLEWIPSSIKKQAVKKFGKTRQAAAEAIKNFNQKVIELVAPLVPVVKPQIAFYEQYGPEGLHAFASTIDFAKKHQLLVIADAKRSDIASTAQAYANSLLGESLVFDHQESVYDADALTINPFLGKDSLEPFVKTCRQHKKGLFILVKTSNPGSQDVQDLVANGKTITDHLAKMVNNYAQDNLNEDNYSDFGAVIGATFPKEAKKLRRLMPSSIFLVPGVGAQGGGYADLNNFFNDDGLGAIVNSSRGLVFSQREKVGQDYLQVIEKKTKRMIKAVNLAL